MWKNFTKFFDFTKFYGNSKQGSDNEIHVLVNGIKKLHSHLDADDNNAEDFLQLSFHCILYLEKDDIIQLRVATGRIWVHDELDSVFTGKLVQKMK